MGLLRNRGPYAPQRRPAQGMDWAVMEAEAARARAEMVRVDEAARKTMIQDRFDADPMNQLVKRCHAIEQRQEGFAQLLAQRGEQLDMLIDLFKEER